MNQLKQKKLYNVLNNLLIVFLSFQPILDIYMGIVGEQLDIFGISIVTILRIAFVVSVFIIVVISQIKYKYHIKYLYVLLGYMFAVFVYTILHHINIVSFNGYFVTEGIYNILTELLYVLRLIIPIILIYIVVITRPSKQEVFRVIVCVTCIISLVIIITNLLETSFASYSQTNEFIKYSVLDWFTSNNLSYNETLSKGYFVSANQIGALLVFLLPMVFYYAIKENRWYLYLVLLAQIISMVLVGTRVANYGWILVSMAIILMYTIVYFMNKVKLRIQSLIYISVILIVGVVLYIHSPSHNRVFASEYEGMYNEELSEIDGTEFIKIEDFKEILQDEGKMLKYLGTTSDNLETDVKKKYIYETYRYHNITKKYILEIYPYTDDVDFWIAIFEEPMSVKGDNRGRQFAIIKRIKENNQNQVLDTLLGMGATPLNNRGYMIENDLISHYYNLGIVGIILFVSPFILAILYALYKNMKNPLNIINVEFAAYVLAILMAYFIGFFAGHVIDEYIISIYLGVVSGLVINFYRKEPML